MGQLLGGLGKIIPVGLAARLDEEREAARDVLTAVRRLEDALLERSAYMALDEFELDVLAMLHRWVARGGRTVS